MIRTLLLLGATGDLAKRFLLPAVGALHAKGLLPPGFSLLGAARSDLDDAALRSLVGDALPPGTFVYRPVDLADPSSLAAVLDGHREPVAVYLALPPAVFATTIESLGAVGLPAGSRIAVEKPFGTDLEGAVALNAILAKTGIDAYRVDHLLGMETTQNLVAMRDRNPALGLLWNGTGVEEVDVLWEETLGLEGRAAYYDGAGALEDVVQSHLLRLLALVGMEPPADGADVQTRRLDVLRAVRVVRSRRGRYTEGTLADGRDVPAYADEEGVDADRCTETFAELVLELAMPRWAGTRFVLRTGKALAEQRKLVSLRLRGGGELEIGIDGPRDVALRLAAAEDTFLDLRSPDVDESLPPYGHVLLDLLRGSNALSVGARGAEENWRVVAPVVEAWKAGTVPLEEYAAGSSGPCGAPGTASPTARSGVARASKGEGNG